MRPGSLLPLTFLLIGCAAPRRPPRDSETVYLRSGDRHLKQSASRTLGTPATRASEIPGTAKKGPPSAHAVPPITTVNEPITKRRAELSKRVNDLSNEEADTVCLSMQLLDRDEIFDPTVRPKRMLFRYIKYASPEDLNYLEDTLNQPRR